MYSVDKTNNIIKISIAVGILLVSLSIGYYYAIHLPQKELQEQLNKEQKGMEIQEEILEIKKERKKLENIQRQSIEEERKYREREKMLRREEQEALQAQREKKARTGNCLAAAYERYIKKWRESCIKEGLEPNCLLPGETAKDYNKAHEQDRNRCYNEYK